MKRHILLQMIGAVLLFAAWHQGWLLPIFTNDATYISWLITGVFLVGVVLLPNRHLCGVDSRWIAIILPMLGILGTIIGFKLAVDGVVGDNFELRDFGIDTALNTTVAGLVGSLWLRLSKRLLG